MKPVPIFNFLSIYLGTYIFIYVFKRSKSSPVDMDRLKSMSKALNAPNLLVCEVYSIVYQYRLVLVENSFLFINLRSAGLQLLIS